MNDKTYQTLFAVLRTGKLSTRLGEVNSNQIKILLKNNQTYFCYQTQNVQTMQITCASLNILDALMCDFHKNEKIPTHYAIRLRRGAIWPCEFLLLCFL